MLRKGESSSTLCNEFGKAGTLQHYKEHFKGSCLLQLVSQWHEENVPKQDLHSNFFNFPGLFVLVTCFLVFSVWLFATTRCKSTLRHCTVFWLKWPVHDLVLVIPPPLLIKVASNIQDHAQNLEEQL